MGWLLELKSADGTDLYPIVRKKVKELFDSGEISSLTPLNPNFNPTGKDMVRLEYVRRLGYYCTESSEHSAEYTNLFIKNKYPELIERYHIPIDEYPAAAESRLKVGTMKSKITSAETSPIRARPNMRLTSWNLWSQMLPTKSAAT